MEMGQMNDSSDGTVSFFTQANALMRKNISFQKRNLGTNIGLVVFPVILCLMLFGIQRIVNILTYMPQRQCECNCMSAERFIGSCRTECKMQYLDTMRGEVSTCPIPKPRRWPPLLQVPQPQFRAAKSASSVDNFTDLPHESCKEVGSCPVTVLVTGGNRSLAERLGQNLFGNNAYTQPSDNEGSVDLLRISEALLLGTEMDPPSTYFSEPAFRFTTPLQAIQTHCMSNFTLMIPTSEIGGIPVLQEVQCVQGHHLWRDSSSIITTELFTGYHEGNSKKKINEILAAYDFLNTNNHNFNATVWYNGTYKNDGLIRIQKSLNLASNSYLQFSRGADVKMILAFLTEMPKPPTKPRKLDLSTLIGPLFFTWVIQLLFPVMLTYLVYEKQHKLRIIMKMHGLGDGPYWMITYAYFLFLSSGYMLCFVIFGSLIGLKSFTLNDYSVQFFFFFIYINLQIVLAFLAATFFSNVKTSTVIGYMYVFGSGLLGSFLFQSFIENSSFPKYWVLAMETFPGFSLYRGLYEFGQYSFQVLYSGAPGLGWKDVNSNENGIKSVLIIMVTEWLVLLLLAFYLDQVVSLGSGIRKHPLWFLKYKFKSCSCPNNDNVQREGFNVLVNMEKPDVCHERELVEKLLLEPVKSHAIICDNLKKVYPRKDGNPEKYAVRELSLALSQGECFGMLGPNGAGKTSFINMMIGLTNPTSGTAFVNGLDIRTDMDKVYCSMGVCPQHDLIWEMLTGREHLLFYGRLKNLKGDALTHAVEESLKNVNLYDGGIADKQAGKYSGGMKRRLSVAISMIGNPQVVYMDEPSTGLDPASRNSLWKVIKHAKQDRAIILTTHSMEEAEALCNRIGIFADGRLQCLGNPNELKARYGEYYVFTITTSSVHEEEVADLASRLSPSANKIYHISGTQKFELPKQDVRITDVFQAIENGKKKFTIHAWGLTDTTLEDVFIKVAKGAQSSDMLS